MIVSKSLICIFTASANRNKETNISVNFESINKGKGSNLSLSSSVRDDKSKLLIKTTQERKDYQNKVETLINRLNRLKKAEESANIKLEKLKQKILKEETNKEYKRQVKSELERAKNASLDAIIKRKEDILKSKSKEKAEKAIREKIKVEKNRSEFTETIDNRHLISELLGQVHDHEKKIKVHNYQKAKERYNQFKMDKKIKDLEQEELRKRRYSGKFHNIVQECGTLKRKLEDLESVEHEALSKINETFSQQQNELNDLRGEITKILRSNLKDLDKSIKIENLVSKIKGFDNNTSNVHNLSEDSKVIKKGISESKSNLEGFSYIRKYMESDNLAHNNIKQSSPLKKDNQKVIANLFQQSQKLQSKINTKINAQKSDKSKLTAKSQTDKLNNKNYSQPKLRTTYGTRLNSLNNSMNSSLTKNVRPKVEVRKGNLKEQITNAHSKVKARSTKKLPIKDGNNDRNKMPHNSKQNTLKQINKVISEIKDSLPTRSASVNKNDSTKLQKKKSV
jgi:hypothetical protein